MGIRQVGETTAEAEGTAVDLASLEGPTVMITACIDRTESDLVYAATGESTRPPGAPAELLRVVSNVKVSTTKQSPRSHGSSALSTRIRTSRASPEMGTTGAYGDHVVSRGNARCCC